MYPSDSKKASKARTNVRCGSFATDLLESPRAVMSATPLKADMAPQYNTVRRMFALLTATRVRPDQNLKALPAGAKGPIGDISTSQTALVAPIVRGDRAGPPLRSIGLLSLLTRLDRRASNAQPYVP